jgi:ethanolaminephosphotransferase
MHLGADRVQLLYRNAKQMKTIVEATYSGVRFDEKTLGSKELGFECSSSAVGSTSF